MARVESDGVECVVIKVISHIVRGRKLQNILIFIYMPAFDVLNVIQNGSTHKIAFITCCAA